MKRKLSEITRDEWIAINWIEDTEIGTAERTFVAVNRRTPDEAARAKDDWDITAEERNLKVSEEEKA
jgi:hypothetical protein